MSPAAAGATFSTGHGYERLMGRWSRALARHFVRFAGVRDREPRDAILDVGSGTGAVAAAVASVARFSHVTCVDPAASSVAFATVAHANDRTRFEVGDARHLRFADDSFDRTLSMLVLNFVPEPARALD